jgi:hypothetical protein
MMEVTTSGPVVIVLSQVLRAKKASPVEVLVFLEEVFIRDPEELGQSAYLVGRLIITAPSS